MCILIIKTDILILGNGPTQGLDDTVLTEKSQYSINSLRSNREIYLSLCYNGSNSFLLLQKYVNSKQKILK